MNWLALALLAMLSGSVRDILEKRVLRREHALEYLATRSFFIIPILLMAIPFIKFNLTLQQTLFIMFVGILVAIGMVYMRKALRHLNISIVEPLMNVNPLLVLLLSFLFLGETITALQFGGIVLIVIGTYILEIDHNHHGLLAPFKKLLESKHSMFAILAATIFAITNTLDRLIVTTFTNPFAYMFILVMTVNVIFLSSHAIKYKLKNIGRNLKKRKARVFLPAITELLMLAFFFSSMQVAPAAGLVVAVFRLKSLISTIEGGRLFHESHLAKKSAACSIMVAGAVLVMI